MSEVRADKHHPSSISHHTSSDCKPDGTMRKLIDVSKLHSLGWTHKVEIEDGVSKLFQWYQQSLS